MDVTLPNGKVIQGVPEGTPKDEIASRAIKAGLAKQEDFPELYQSTIDYISEDIRDPSIFEAITGERQITPEIEGLKEIGAAPEMNQLSLGSLRSAIGLLATGDTQKGVDIVKQAVPEAEVRQDGKGNVIFDLPSGSYVLNQPGISAQDLTRLGFQAAAFTPAGRAASIPRAAAGSGITESALQAGALQAGADEVDLAEIALATGLGGAGKSLEDIVSAVTRWRRGSIPEDQQRIIQTGEESGVPVMTTDVVPPETLPGRLARSTGETIPVAGTGAQRAAQQKAREEIVDATIQDLSPRFDEVVGSLKAKTDKIRKAAGERLGSIASEMDQVGFIPVDRAIRAIDDEIAALAAPGRVPDEQTIATLRRYKEALEQGQDFRTLDTLRSDFREAVRGDRQSLPSRSDAASNRIYKALTNDLNQSIVDNLGTRRAQQWGKAKSVWAREANELKKSRLKSVLESGDVTPEKVRNVLFSQNASEMNKLYRSLTPDGRRAARATILNEMIERLSKRASGVTPNSLASEINKNRKTIEAFFKGEEKEQLLGLQKFLDATRRAQDAPVATPTGQSLMGILGVGGAVADLGATLGAGVTLGTMARIYESPMVRNALLRLGSIKRGSDAYDVAVSEVSQAVTAASQAIAQESTSE